MHTYYTVMIPWAPADVATKWHPTERSGAFSILVRGSFRDRADAILWAESNLNGTEYSIITVLPD